MLVAVIATGLGGVGVWMMLVGLVPPKLTLAEQMARVSAAAHGIGQDAEPVASLVVGLGNRAGSLLERFGLPGSKVVAELDLLRRDVRPHLALKAGCALAGLVLPVPAFTVLTIANIDVPAVFPAALGLAFASVLFMVPDLALHAEAERWRAAARMAVRAFLDQAAITVAGGAGVEHALIVAADGNGPTFRAIREAIAEAQLRREPAWPHLDGLGRRLGIRELSELAAACALAGAEGSKIKASIAAKAAAMREREFATQVEAAESATERLGLPGGLLAMSVVCFVGYAALAAAAKQIR
jgi:hypothetical protein